MQRIENIPNNKKITVHVLNFWKIYSCHMEIIIETSNKEFYRINSMTAPSSAAIFQDKKCLHLLAKAPEIETIEIDGDINQIIDRWQEKYKKENQRFGLLNNCADVAAWFLDEFADIKIPGSCAPPITINYLCCGLFAPSFLQCCTLPGRVFDVVSSTKNNKKLSEHLPDFFNDEAASFRKI